MDLHLNKIEKTWPDISQAMFDFAVKTFLFLLPIFTFKDYQTSFARELFFVTGVFVLFGLSLCIKQKRSFSNIWLTAFFLLALVRVFFDGDVGGGEWFNFWLSFAGFIYVFCGVLLFRTVYCYCDGVRKYFKPIIAVCILNFILTMAQVLACKVFWIGVSARSISYPCGFMETPAQLGQYSAMSFPILLYVNPFLSIIPLTTAILSKSVTSAAALSSGILFIGWQLKNKLFVSFFIFVIIFFALLNSYHIKNKWHTRPVMWQKTISFIAKKPFLGWGYRSFNRVVMEGEEALGIKDLNRAHSDILHTAQELGIPILLIMGMFFAEIFNKFRKIVNKDKLVIFLAASMMIVLINLSGQMLIRYASIAGTFIVLLALFCIKLEEN